MRGGEPVAEFVQTMSYLLTTNNRALATGHFALSHFHKLSRWSRTAARRSDARRKLLLMAVADGAVSTVLADTWA